MDKEVWRMEAKFAFVLDDKLWKEAEIHLLRWAFVQYVDLNPWTDMYTCRDTQIHKAQGELFFLGVHRNTHNYKVFKA